MDLGRPDIDWVSLARTLGVEAFRAATADELSRHVKAGLASGVPASSRSCSRGRCPGS